MNSAYAGQSVASRQRARYFSREATRSANAGWISRRLWWRALGQGSGKKVQSSSSERSGSRWAIPATASAAITRTLLTSSLARLLTSLAIAGWYTSKARMLHSGRARAIGTSDSPVPGPTSTISGAWRPNSSSRSRSQSGCTEVDVSSRGTSMTNPLRCCSQARRWPTRIRLLRRTKETTSRRTRDGRSVAVGARSVMTGANVAGPRRLSEVWAEDAGQPLAGDVLAGEAGPGQQPERAGVHRGGDQAALQVVEEDRVAQEVSDGRPPVGQQPRVQPVELADLAEDEHPHVDQQHRDGGADRLFGEGGDEQPDRADRQGQEQRQLQDQRGERDEQSVPGDPDDEAGPGAGGARLHPNGDGQHDRHHGQHGQSGEVAPATEDDAQLGA